MDDGCILFYLFIYLFLDGLVFSKFLVLWCLCEKAAFHPLIPKPSYGAHLSTLLGGSVSGLYILQCSSHSPPDGAVSKSDDPGGQDNNNLMHQTGRQILGLRSVNPF